MSVDQRLRDIREVEGRINEALTRLGQASALQGGDGGGTSGGMEARVARLESDMEHVKKAVDRLETSVSDTKKSLGEVKTTVSVLDERSKHFPTRTELLTTSAVMVAIIGAIVALIVRFLPAAG
jgi:tetrahydromethanopterin S-methyltransferase subunit B